MSNLTVDVTDSLRRKSERPMIERTRLGRILHRLFGASLVIKGILAASESMSGLGLILTPNHLILSFVTWLTRNELTQDPADDMAQWARHIAENFPIQTQHFYAWYLLAHGALKFLMVILLTRRVRWAYPAAMVVLAAFVTYQLYDWTISHSPVLLGLSALDAIMIGLVWREWREMSPAVRPAD